MNQATYLYKYFDQQGKLLYVGITNNLNRRVSEHNRDAWWMPANARVKFEIYNSRGEAENAEIRAIKELKPLYNVKHNVPVMRGFKDVVKDLAMEQFKNRLMFCFTKGGLALSLKAHMLIANVGQENFSVGRLKALLDNLFNNYGVEQALMSKKDYKKVMRRFLALAQDADYTLNKPDKGA